jgi:curli biogenesis system outer membrane secretion channel CsgG
MRKLIIISLSIFIAISFCSLARAEKPTITVYGFDCKASSGFWHDAKWDIGTGMGEMLVDALMSTGRFNVMERLNIGDITTEQDLVGQGRVSKKTGAKTGQMIGAQYIARGTLTEFDISKSGGMGGINIKGISFGLEQSKAHIAGIIRIYDATTGQIIASQRFSRSVPATGVKFGYHRGGIGGDLGGFKKTPLGKATHFAIQDIVDFIVSTVPMEAPSVVCAKCGTKASTSSDFCPKCGERIIVAITNCPGCGEEVLAGAKFCGNCGRQLAGIKCPQCNKELTSADNFCPDCGAQIVQQ